MTGNETRIRFQENPWHRYWLDGKPISSVTAILNSSLNKRGLVKWAAREAAIWGSVHAGELDQLGPDEWVALATNASDRVRDQSVETGRAVHELAERLIYGGELPAETAGEPWPPDVLAMARQLADFFDRTNAQPVVHESIVYNEQFGYAGRLDLIADLELPVSSGRWLLDYKTGASGVWGESSLQLTAYRAATKIQIVAPDEELSLIDVDMPPVDACGVIWVRPDGWQLLPVVTDAAQFEVFKSMIPVSRWSRIRRDDLIGGPILDGKASA